MITVRPALLILTLCATLGFASETPAELLGDWKLSEGSGSSYRDARTGAFNAPNINSYLYRFLPDGKYHHAAMLSSSLYNCTMQIFGFEIGELSVDGGRISMDDLSATITSKDSCRPQWNYQKLGKLSKSTYEWRVEKDSLGTVLILRHSDGKEDRYYKQPPSK